ncbi:hypothetical protein HID58_023208 [Brassica napus]|uniref:Uncharacterized protein n=1 Tax=Brassica napus TaxID=3708 RepID=A0ABQ8D1E9_BRANA|nr:hypothetical protein HID58_023208 [Brassica napus]
MEFHQLLEHMFAADEKSSGERNIKQTESILDTLDLKEIEYMWNSTFDKILAIGSIRSMRCGSSLLGSPVRMSLREFAIVMGLKCWKVAKASNFVALKGYVDAIQLVMISAVPPLKEVVVQNEHAVVIESDSEIETTSKDHMDMYTYSLTDGLPNHVDVKYILDDHAEDCPLGIDLGWSDEEEDEVIDNLVRFVGEDYIFHNEIFKGGLDIADFVWIRNERKQKKKEAKKIKTKGNVNETANVEASDPTLTEQVESLLLHN